MPRLLPLLLLAGAIALAETAPERRGLSPRDLFEARCSTCHDPGRVRHRVATRDEWREIVDRMRRMPQSGISPQEAEVILDYLVSLQAGGGARERDVKGGRAAYGEAWLSVLEVRTVAERRVKLGGVEYEVERAGDTAVVFVGEGEHVLALPAGKEPARTLLLDAWRVGAARYEVHLLLYEIRDDRLRLARALRKIAGKVRPPPS